MLSGKDLIVIPYTPDMTQAGIMYAVRSLAYTYDRMGGSPVERLRRIAAGKGVELAFRRRLNQTGVLYDNLGDTPFSEPDHYDIAIGGRLCDLKSYQIFEKKKISWVHQNPSHLLEATALVPTDQVMSEHLKDEDLYIFAFSTVLVTRYPSDVRLAIEHAQPVYWIYSPPAAWAQPKMWKPLGPLALKSDDSQPVQVEIGGQDRERRFQTETLLLLPRERITALSDFYNLAYLHPTTTLTGRLGVHSPRFHIPLIIQPGDWGNIWVYGMKVILAGYMPRGEFHRRAAHLPPGSQVFQYPRTRTTNLALPVHDLHPLESLFKQAIAWKR